MAPSTALKSPARYSSLQVNEDTQLDLDTEYHQGHSSVQQDSDSNEKKTPRFRVRHPKSRVPGFGLIISFLAGFLWLAPAGFLLYLNLSGWVIGPSAWCRDASCNVMTYLVGTDSTYAQRAAEADAEDHNLLGALQFAAKAMEVWFGFIAAAFLYLVSSNIAKRPRGLPLGYLFMHLEYADLRSLLSLSFWRPATGRLSAAAAGRRRRASYSVGFALLAALLCIISNLMGPSIAVLMIPTLNWVETPYQASGSQADLIVDTVFASTGPAELLEEFLIPGCTTADLADGRMSCTSVSYGPVWNAMLNTLSSTLQQRALLLDGDQTEVLTALGDTFHFPSTESLISFSFNYSNDVTREQIFDDSVSQVAFLGRQWAPNRQVLRQIAQDVADVSAVILNGSQTLPYAQFNDSLELELLRRGPILGLDAFYSRGRLIELELSEDREVRCIEGYDVIDSTNLTKCYQFGSGWGGTQSNATFRLPTGTGGGASSTESDSSSIEINFFWTEGATYFTQDDADRVECLGDDDSSCDWDGRFNSPLSGPAATEAFSRLQPPALVATYSFQGDAGWVIEMFPFMGMSTYSIDVTTLNPTMESVRTLDLPSDTDPIVLHAEWILAAWSTDRAAPDFEFGDLFDSDFYSAATIASGFSDLQDLFNTLGDDEPSNQDVALASQIVGMAHASALQALSLVPYSTALAGQAQLDEAAAAAEAEERDTQSRLLTSTFRRRVWKFGLESRTSYVGITVMLAGVLVVLLRSVLMLFANTTSHSTVTTLASALQHIPRPEEGLDGPEKESELSKMRFRVTDLDYGERIGFERVG